VTDFAPGDRVLSLGNHATHWIVDLTDSPTRNDCIQKLGDEISDEQATFGINGATALHAVRRARIQIDGSVAVFGAGVIGQLVTSFSRPAGAHALIGVDLTPGRLELARGSGATHTVNADAAAAVAAVRKVVDAGAQCVFHASADPRLLQPVMETAGHRAKVSMVGSAPGTAEFDLQVEMLRRELTIVGAYEAGLEMPHAYWPWTPQRDCAVDLCRICDRSLQVDLASDVEGWMAIIITWD
jgi:threonine dehydrogenase-like Zn-dependent dehydrogenase